MLRVRGVRVQRSATGDGGVRVSLEGGQTVMPIDERVPGDVSAAMFWLVAGAVHDDADLTIREVGVNPTRRAGMDLLRAMGARIDEARVTGHAVADAGEPLADLTVRSSELHGIDIGPREVAASIDEIPVLCLAAALADGRTTIRGAGELRHKESDRIGGIIAGLRTLGARIEVDGDDLAIDGPARLAGAPTDSLGDHRLAMTFAIAGLLAPGETTVTASSSAAVSYPSFFGDLERIRA
jgi:3-phosphoshikimate 1-carboxyvinyltransferase